MTVASAAAQTAARVLVVAVILFAACEPAGARPRHRHRSFCAPVIAVGVGLVRICAPTAPARR